MSKFETLMPIKTKGALPPLFCVHGEPLKMAMRMKADRPVYGLSHVYHSSFQKTVADTIDELAGQYLDDVYKVCPDGPYHLLGFSAGSTIAYEMARQLLESGRKVDSLVMIEPPLMKLAADLGNKSQHVKDYFRETGLSLSTLVYLFKRVYSSLASRTLTLLNRIKVSLLLKLGKELPEDLRWLGYLRALGPALNKYDYQPITCPSIVVYRSMTPETQNLVTEFWSERLGSDVKIHFEEGASGHNDFMLDPHLSNISQLLDESVARQP